MNRVDLIVPGLLNLPAEELDLEALRQATPNLHRLLRFAKDPPNEHYELDEILIHRLNLDQSALPYARAMNPHGRLAQMLFKPIFLKSDINNAIVYPVSADEGDIRLLINELSEYFKADCDITSVGGDYWLLQLKHVKALWAMPHVLTATGKKVSHYLDQAKSNMGWFKLFNEMQMFLFQHKLNQQRFAAGAPMINSLWCWGGDDYKGERFENLAWFSDDMLMQHLGKLYSSHSHSLSEIPARAGKQDALVINLSLLETLKGASSRPVMEILLELENRYLQPLMQLSPEMLTLHTGGGVNYCFKKSMQWKFWKQPRYLLT